MHMLFAFRHSCSLVGGVAIQERTDGVPVADGRILVKASSPAIAMPNTVGLEAPPESERGKSMKECALRYGQFGPDAELQFTAFVRRRSGSFTGSLTDTKASRLQVACC